MITIQHPVSFSADYPLKRLGPADNLLFFDIETTGFSPASSNLYLIGCIFYDRSAACWTLIQWFADNPEAEPECLEAFFSMTREKTVLVHFNGDTFDLPYLAGRARHYGIPFDLSHTESIDIFRRIRPCRKLLGMDSMKLKAVEQFLGISREDRYTGGQLIQVYTDYLTSQSPARLHLLLLHNEDDLKGMAAILPVLSYPDMLRDGGTFSESRLLSPEETESFGESPVLQMDFTGSWHLPVPLSHTVSGAKLSFRDSSIRCRIPLYRGCLKYFFPDYENYYYLPAEDMAVHKSVGAYVAKSARKKATARTCYTKKEGLFIPQPKRIWEPEFREEYGSPVSYAAWTPELLSDPEKASDYLKLLLEQI